MVGLGEEFDEMVETFGILREHGVQVLTVGQYLRPTENHLPVDPLLAPRRVRGARARPRYEIGFESVAAGPAGPQLSYHADESAREVLERRAAAVA